MKLIRPLHRQRTRKRNRAEVLNSAELAVLFGVPAEDLAAYLQRRNISYHKDSNGEIWVSQEVTRPEPTQPPHTP